MNFYGPVINISHLCMPAQLLSRVRLFVTLWTAARQAPLSMEFFKQEYYSGLTSPSPGDLPDSEIEHVPPVSPDLAGGYLPLCHLV